MEVDGRDRWARLRALEVEARVLHARLLEELGALAEEWPDGPGVPDLASEVARELSWSRGGAEDRIRTAAALRHLPELASSVQRGELSAFQARWVARFATLETDAHWASMAPRMTPRQLQLESWRQARAGKERSKADHDMRYVRTGWDDDGAVLSIEGQLPAEQGVTFEEALRTASRGIETDPDAHDAIGARQADALVAMVSSGGGGSRPSLVVHADVDVLAGVSDGTRKIAETASGIQLHPDAVRRIACDARVRIALERQGEPVGVVTSGRHVSAPQWELLEFRDRGCTYPGCAARRHLHAHHIRHWADGGKTSVPNLTLLCGRHHRMVHEGGWTIRGRPPDGLEFVDRWGTAVRSARAPASPRAG